MDAETRDQRIKRIAHDQNVSDTEATRVADFEIRFENLKKVTGFSEASRLGD